MAGEVSPTALTKDAVGLCARGRLISDSWSLDDSLHLSSAARPVTASFVRTYPPIRPTKSIMESHHQPHRLDGWPSKANLEAIAGPKAARLDPSPVAILRPLPKKIGPLADSLVEPATPVRCACKDVITASLDNTDQLETKRCFTFTSSLRG